MNKKRKQDIEEKFIEQKGSQQIWLEFAGIQGFVSPALSGLPEEVLNKIPRERLDWFEESLQGTCIRITLRKYDEDNSGNYYNIGEWFDEEDLVSNELFAEDMSITISSNDVEIEDADEIREFLNELGISEKIEDLGLEYSITSESLGYLIGLFEDYLQDNKLEILEG